MVILDRELERQPALYRVSRNCRGYVLNGKPVIEESIIREIESRGLTVSVEGDDKKYRITCPKFITDEGKVCLNSAIRRGLRECMCTNNNQNRCATYNPSIGVNEPITASLVQIQTQHYNTNERRSPISESFR